MLFTTITATVAINHIINGIIVGTMIYGAVAHKKIPTIKK